MKRLLLLICVVLFLASLPVSAATITYTDWVASNQAYTTTPLLGQFDLPQFNPSLGTLTSVTLTYTFYWNQVTASVTNNSTTSDVQYSIQGAVRSSLTGPGYGTVNYTAVLFTDPEGYPDVYVTVPPDTKHEISISPQSGDAQWVKLLTTGLGAFTGTSSLTYSLSAQNRVLGDFIGDTTYSQAAWALGELQITYDYISPEPATMAFAGIGLLLLGFVGRRFISH